MSLRQFLKPVNQLPTADKVELPLDTMVGGSLAGQTLYPIATRGKGLVHNLFTLRIYSIPRTGMLMKMQPRNDNFKARIFMGA